MEQIKEKNGFLNRIKNLFFTLIQDNSDEKEIEEELKRINNVQINLKKEKDYINSLEVEVSPKVKATKAGIKNKQNKKHKEIDMEIGE